MTRATYIAFLNLPLIGLKIFHPGSNKKANKKGEISIHVRITIDGFNDEFSTGIKVLSDQWDSEANDKQSLSVNPTDKKRYYFEGFKNRHLNFLLNRV